VNALLALTFTAALALTAPPARAEPAAASPAPSSYAEAMADDQRPLRRGVTFELGLGAALTYVTHERADAQTGVGPTTLAVSAGYFVTPKVALLARWAGTTFFDKNASGDTTQVIVELGGWHLQYWANDFVSLSAGPALAVIGVNPLLASDFAPKFGFGGSSRFGYSIFTAKHHVLRVSWETFNSKIARSFVFGSALSIEWQYF
jgi:hypothetical protein